MVYYSASRKLILVQATVNTSINKNCDFDRIVPIIMRIVEYVIGSVIEYGLIAVKNLLTKEINIV